MAREYFCAYHNLLHQLKSLSDAEFGRLIRATLEYSETGKPPKLSGREAIMLESMMWQVDTQAAAYEATCKKNAANARSRWKKQASGAGGKNSATACGRIPPHATADINKNKEITPIPPKGGDVAAAMTDDGIAAVAQCWEQNIGVLSPAVGEYIAGWCSAVEPAMVCAVIKYAVFGGKRNGNYVDSVIRNAVARNITTLAAWEAEQRERHAQQTAPAEKKEAGYRWL